MRENEKMKERDDDAARRWSLPPVAREAAVPFAPPEETRDVARDVEASFPDRVGYLVWTPDRLARLGEAVDAALDRREIRPMEARPLIRRSVLNQLTGLGPLDSLLLDDRVTEIMVNRFDDVMVERDGVLDPVASMFVDDDEVLALALRLAARSGRNLNSESPMADARLADGSRISLVIPPVSEHPALAIRRANDGGLEPDDLVRLDSLSGEVWEYLVDAVHRRRNMIVAGGAGTGKTHLARLLLREVGPQERLVVIEDVRELNLERQGVVALEARGRFSTHDLIVQALRLRPDRIVVGEVRGGEALDLIEAMASGHPGSLSTVHSPGPGLATIHRIARAAMRNAAAMPYTALLEEIRAALDLVVFLARDDRGRRGVFGVDAISVDGIQPIFVRDADGLRRVEPV
jgi:pilus assembly protein CpaF